MYYIKNKKSDEYLIDIVDGVECTSNYLHECLNYHRECDALFVMVVGFELDDSEWCVELLEEQQ